MEAEGEQGVGSGPEPRYLLLGSGEYESWVGDVESRALEHAHGDGTVALLATASAPEGEATFARWNQMGLEHYRSLGVPARALLVREREDALRPENVEAVRRASMVFFSGGNPEYLARHLEGTPLWAALQEALAGGSIYAGCSAGAMVAGSTRNPRPGRGRFRFTGGLGLLPTEVFGVHWDSPFMKVLRPRVRAQVPPGCRLIGIAERTAILSEGAGWRVSGRGRVEVQLDHLRRSYREGDLIPPHGGLAPTGPN
ncbi:MAG: Type 1 glutamine amidotransferase-like domain-containing protein [Candidatus Dormibacteria bacterium]